MLREGLENEISILKDPKWQFYCGNTPNLIKTCFITIFWLLWSPGQKTRRKFCWKLALCAKRFGLRDSKLWSDTEEREAREDILGVKEELRTGSRRKEASEEGREGGGSVWKAV